MLCATLTTTHNQQYTMDSNNNGAPADGSAITQQLVDAFKAAIPQAPPPQQPQLSQEQIQQMLGYWRPDETLVRNLFGESAGEQQTAGLSAMLERIEDMIDKRATVIAQGLLGDYHGTVSPMLNDVRELSQERFQSQLYSGDGEAFKPYQKMLEMVMPQLQQAPDFPQKRTEQVKYLQGKFSELVQQANPQFAGTTARQTPQAPVAPLPAFGGGAGGSAPQGGSVNPATASAPMSLAQVMNGGKV